MIVVEVIPFLTTKDKLKLLRMNKKYKTGAYEGYVTITREVEESYDDRQRKS